MTKLSAWKCDLCGSTFLASAKKEEVSSLTLTLPRKRTIVTGNPPWIPRIEMADHHYDVCGDCAELLKSVLLQKEAFLAFMKEWRGAGYGRKPDNPAPEELVKAIDVLIDKEEEARRR